MPTRCCDSRRPSSVRISAWQWMAWSSRCPLVMRRAVPTIVLMVRHTCGGSQVRVLAWTMAGHDPYPFQIHADRIVPLWGGLSEGGFAIVTFHRKRKFTTSEWCRTVGSKLKKAIEAVKPVQRHGTSSVTTNLSCTRARMSEPRRQLGSRSGACPPLLRT